MSFGTEDLHIKLPMKSMLLTNTNQRISFIICIEGRHDKIGLHDALDGLSKGKPTAYNCII